MTCKMKNTIYLLIALFTMALCSSCSGDYVSWADFINGEAKQWNLTKSDDKVYYRELAEGSGEKHQYLDGLRYDAYVETLSGKRLGGDSGEWDYHKLDSITPELRNLILSMTPGQQLDIFTSEEIAQSTGFCKAPKEGEKLFDVVVVNFRVNYWIPKPLIFKYKGRRYEFPYHTSEAEIKQILGKPYMRGGSSYREQYMCYRDTTAWKDVLIGLDQDSKATDVEICNPPSFVERPKTR